MAFHEVQFPTNISYGSSGGPSRRTDIVVLDSGFEQRNTPWAQSRHKYNISSGLKTYDDLHTLKAFWEARLGALYGFRYKDWADFKSVAPQATVGYADQTIGTGNSSTTTFQLIKTYVSGLYSYTRTINKPVTGTVRVSVNNVEVTSGWTIDTSTGLVTFTTAPGTGDVVKAGFEFDVPVRFESDQIMIDLQAFSAGVISDINLLEIRV